MKVGQRDARRLLERMGLRLEPVEGVEEVIIRKGDREIVVKAPSVAQLRSSEMTIYQIMGGEVEERLKAATAPSLPYREEDVELVALQAGVAKEQAVQALKEAGGDLAKAILLLQRR